MRVVIQRVSHASVTIDGQCKSAIGEGMMILVGIEESDAHEDADWLVKKILNLRIFDDDFSSKPVHFNGFYQERQSSIVYPGCPP